MIEMTAAQRSEVVTSDARSQIPMPESTAEYSVTNVVSCG